MTTPVIVNQQTISGGGVSSLQVTMTGVTAGNVLAGCLTKSISATRSYDFSDNKSNTWVSAGRAGTARQAEIEYALNAAPGDTVVTCQINTSTSSFTVVVFELTGVDSIGSTDTYIDESNSKSHPCADPAVDTNAECIIITATQCNSSPGLITPATGYTNEHVPSNGLIQSRISESALTGQTATWTSSTARRTYSVFAEFYNSQAGGGLLPIIGDLTSTTGMSSSFSGRAGVGGGLDTSSEKNTMLQAGSEGRQGDLTSALNHLLPILLGKTGAAGDLAADLHNSIAVAGSQGSRGDLSSGLSLTALLFGSNTDQAGPAVYEGSLSAVAARLDTELFGATGAAGDLSARIMNAASLIGQLGMTGSATIRLDPVAAMIEGLLGVSGEVAVTLSTGAELAGQLGISGDLVADLEPLGLMLLQIARSEKIYRIVISTQSGRAVLLKPEFGTINISTTIN